MRYFNYSRLNNSGDPAPNALITVYRSGTLTLATIFADADGTPKSNPFTSDASGYFFFYAPDGTYDVRLSGGGIVTPYTWVINLGGGEGAGQFVSAESFGATGDGVTDDQPAFQAADAFATLIGGATITFFKGTSGLGTFKLGSGLVINQGNLLLGPEGQQVQFRYAGSGDAITFVGPIWGKSGNFLLFTTHADANGVKIIGESRHAQFNLIQCVGANTLLTTGSGFYYDSVTGFSYMAVMQNCDSTGYKYGLRVESTNMTTNTWTVIACHDCVLSGRAAGVIPNSAGIYCGPNANLVGSTFTGGTIESFADIMVVDSTSKGFSIWLSDAEGNTRQSIDVPNSYTGTSYMPQAAYLFTQIPNGLADPSSAWIREQWVGGDGPIFESYYAPTTVVYAGGGDSRVIRWMRGDSLIKGGSPTLMGALNLGGGSTQTDQLPYFQIGSTQRIYNHNTIPSTGVWTKGFVVTNTAPATGGIPGAAAWICTDTGDFAGTPPTFNAIPFVVDFSATINPGLIAAGAQYETNVSVSGWGFTTNNAFVQYSPGTDTSGLQITCRMVSSDTVRVSIFNPTGGGITPSSSTWKFRMSQ